MPKHQKPLSTVSEVADKVMSVMQANGDDSLLPTNGVIATTVPDPFDPASLRVTPEAPGVSIRKVITTVSCRKPGRQEFIRVHADEEWRLDTLFLEDKEGREYYLVAPGLRDYVMQDAFIARLTTAVTRSGDLFLWLLKLPGPDGKSNRWNDSALAAAQLAETKWVRVVSNLPSNCYDVFEASGIKIEPNWPDLSFQEILKLCFKDRFIDSPDHPFLKKLRGEV